jgi:hypothetical protein
MFSLLSRVVVRARLVLPAAALIAVALVETAGRRW